MNFRMMTISGVLVVAWAIPAGMVAADEHGPITNLLRDPGPGSAAENALRPSPTTPLAAEAQGPRSQPGFWRSSSGDRPGDSPRVRVADRSPPAEAASRAPLANGTPQPPAAQPPRTWLQRIRERRISQLEKQAERLRQLEQRENQHAPGGRSAETINGPENPDLQIDLGSPVDAPGGPTAGPAPPDTPASSPGSVPAWQPDRPGPTAGTSPPELNPPAEPPLEVNIELPDDVQSPEPKPALQNRPRTWWSSPARPPAPTTPRTGS